MAVTSRGRAELQIPNKWRDRETSPERTKIWTEPKIKSEKKVPVVYYLSRNGQLEHPHFMEVSLSSHEGLYLRDVLNRLNLLRGKGMANQYSWSSKRSYRNGFVWHDLAENDFIYPAQGKEYVLKGSEILEPSLTLNSNVMSSSLRFQKLPEIDKAEEDSDFPVISRRRNQSWNSIDLHEYKVYKESTGESSGKAAADASTQTDDKRRRRRAVKEEEELDEPYQNQSTELSREEISPPPSDSSPETLESLMKADGRLILGSGSGDNEDGLNQKAENCPSGRMKASTVLMQLLSCGSVSFRDCGAMAVKNQGLSLVGPYKGRLDRGAGNYGEEEEGALRGIQSFERVRLEEKEYFSGSLIETKKEDVPALKRSSSYNADRSSQLQLAEDEEDGVRAKCIPRKAKTLQSKKNSSSSRHVSYNTQQGS